MSSGAFASTTVARECPRGDGPAPTGEFVLTGVTTHVDVLGGAAAVRHELTFTNGGDGPAEARVVLSTLLGEERTPPLIVQQARVMAGDRAILEDADVATTRYQAFVEALQDGVDPAEARSGRRAALHVSEGHEGDTVIEVAAACSVRTMTVQVNGAILAEPRDGGERYVVPTVGHADRLVIAADAGELWVDGVRPRGGQVVRRDHDDGVNDEDDDRRPFVIDLRDNDAGLRASGSITVVKPAVISDAPAARRDGDDFAADDDTTVSPLHEAGFSLLGATLAVPMPMSTPPPGVKLVFVVDASVSAGDGGVARALQLISAILDAAPADTGWALVAMRRHAELVVGPWRPRDQRFLPHVPVGNGSDVVEAVQLARRMATDAEAGAGRVIVLSDLQLKDGDEARLVRTLSGSDGGPVVHIATLPADTAVDEDLDFTRVLPGDGPLAVATAHTRGIVVQLQSASVDTTDATLATHLIRPTRLDDLRLVVDGRDVGPLEHPARLQVTTFGDAASEHGIEAMPEWLGEGGGLRIAATLPAGARRVQIRALAWADEVTVDVEALPSKAGAVAAATATNHDLRDVFSGAGDALEVIARRLGFVSAVTSLVAIPTFRPARPEGLGMRGSGGCGCGGCSMSGRSGHAFRCGIGTSKTLMARQILDTLAAEIAQACRASVDASIDVGDLEIRDVVARGPGNACVADHLWRARLDRLTPGDGSFEANSTFAMAATWTPEDTGEDDSSP